MLINKKSYLDDYYGSTFVSITRKVYVGETTQPERDNHCGELTRKRFTVHEIFVTSHSSRVLGDIQSKIVGLKCLNL